MGTTSGDSVWEDSGQPPRRVFGTHRSRRARPTGILGRLSTTNRDAPPPHPGRFIPSSPRLATAIAAPLTVMASAPQLPRRQTAGAQAETA